MSGAPEALRLADRLSSNTGHVGGPNMDAAAAELRRQHARIAELEAQLEAIGAGGVSGPLMGQPQEMPDLTTLTERGAKAWAGVDAQGLRESVASAGSEPVAYAIFSANGNIRLWSKARIPHPDAKPLYLHPSPPEGMVGGWIALPGTLPEPGTPVLLDIGKKSPIRAMWAAKFTLLVSLEDDSGFGEHDERTDEWYCPEGWYEWNEHEETHWRVTATPRAWTPLPPTTSAGSKGE